MSRTSSVRPLVLVGLAIAAGLALLPGAGASTWPGCDSFDTQPEAQAYWESHGRPAEADGDGDGRVCVIYS